MATVPGAVDADRGPPMTIPLRHFVVGFGLLVGGSVIGLGAGIGAIPGSRLAHVHLLFVGWICVTIMGAMTQFVPVWSGTELHSRTLAAIQLWLVGIGVVGFAGLLLGGELRWVPIAGGVMLLGIWVFVYNIARTLLPTRPWDITERHFALTLVFFLFVTALGVVLSIGFTRPVVGYLGVTHAGVRSAHVTLAVFGVLLTVIFGALYQLATMFTQTELHGIDEYLSRFEAVGYPSGVVILAIGRLVENTLLGRIGGVLVALGVLGMGVILARRLYESRVEWTPMLSRYAVAAAGMIGWAVLTVPVWLGDPLSPRTLYGAPGTVHLLGIGIVGFVVLGTLYHVVPFIVWVHRYSDQLGFTDVPMIDDLYDDRLAAVDFALLFSGTVLLVGSDMISLPPIITGAGGALLVGGSVVFVGNIVSVLRRHSPYSLLGILFGRGVFQGATETAETQRNDP